MCNDIRVHCGVLVRMIGAASMVVACNSDELVGASVGQSGGDGTVGASAGEDDGSGDGGGSTGDEGGVSDSLSGTGEDASDSNGESEGDSDSNGGGTNGESDGDSDGCPPDEPLCGIPEADLVPVEVPDGLPGPLPGVYDDPQPAAGDQEFRALLGFPIRDRDALAERLRGASDPTSPTYGQAMTTDAWMTAHAPTTDDFAVARAWLVDRGFAIDFTATNRLLIQFSGTAAQFNAAFGVELLVCMRENPHPDGDAFPVFCTATDGLWLPKFVADRTNGVVAADLPAETGELPGEAGKVEDDHPGDEAFTPQQIAEAYGLRPLYEAGFTGQGVTLGVVAAATYHEKDLRTFWKSFAVERALPTRVQTLEPIVTRLTETIRDVQWASVLAPGADVIVYEGPDARNTALLYTFNEAVARAEVDVLTDSFDHREDSEPAPLRHQYDDSAMMGAAVGITVVGASGNSARPDIPCSSPHVTCVGGTELVTEASGEVVSEVAWRYSGSGDTLTFTRPYWQDEVVDGDKRAVCDLAVNASEESPYWLRRYKEWVYTDGTSVSAPVFAAIVAVVDSARIAAGEPTVGFFNPTLYRDPEVRASFRDITEGETEFYSAGEGWDYPTGWGAPHAQKLFEALP